MINRRWQLGALVSLCFVFSLLCHAENPKYASVVHFEGAEPAPVVDAKAWVLMEINSGWIVSAYEGQLAMPPASITKLMTNYVVYRELQKGNISLNDEVVVSDKAWRAEGSRMFAEAGSSVSLEHLLKSTVIQSGNDAAIALSEHVAGSEASFAELMNQHASRLGMSASHFINSTGLPHDEHKMSARDIAVLAAALIREFPGFYRWYSEKQYSHNNITQFNRNKLLWKDDSVDGLKTGHTNAAGYCLVGSAIRDNTRWIAVVLGSRDEASREKAVLELLNYGFDRFTALNILDQQAGISELKVYKGEHINALLKPINPVSVVIPKVSVEKIDIRIEKPEFVRAPIEIGQPLGSVHVDLAQTITLQVPLVSMSAIKSVGWIDGLVDEIKIKWASFQPKKDDSSVQND